LINYIVTGVLINPLPDQEGNKLMFLSEWREFLSALCLAGKKKFDDSSRLDVVEIARVPDMLPGLKFRSFMSIIIFCINNNTYSLHAAECFLSS